MRPSLVEDNNRLTFGRRRRSVHCIVFNRKLVLSSLWFSLIHCLKQVSSCCGCFVKGCVCVEGRATGERKKPQLSFYERELIELLLAKLSTRNSRPAALILDCELWIWLANWDLRVAISNLRGKYKELVCFSDLLARRVNHMSQSSF